MYKKKSKENLLFSVNTKYTPGSGSDRTIASERQIMAFATLYIGGIVTCSQKKTQGA